MIKNEKDIFDIRNTIIKSTTEYAKKIQDIIVDNCMLEEDEVIKFRLLSSFHLIWIRHLSTLTNQILRELPRMFNHAEYKPEIIEIMENMRIDFKVSHTAIKNIKENINKAMGEDVCLDPQNYDLLI